VSKEGDNIAHNNTSETLLSVATAPRVLFVSSALETGVFSKVLESAGILVDVVSPSQMVWDAARLAPYKVVILENVLLEKIGSAGTRVLAEAVRSGVCGLIVAGGEGSFGNGGYHKSPLDELLPVTMELRQEQRRGKMALVAVLDRSGSMAAPVSKSRTKMDLANAGVAEAIRLLSNSDEISVIAVDSSAHVIIPLAQADETGNLINAVRRIRSQGGGIFVHTALIEAAKQIRKSNLTTRHILLFSDASDSEEQQGSIKLVKELKKEGIGVSVIGLGTTVDVDADFLKKVAKNGGGQVYFTNRPQELPQVFSQEVIRVSKRGFIQELTQAKLLPDIIRLNIKPDVSKPKIGAYNLTYLRKDASCAMVTKDENVAPVVAFWQRGRASVGALTAEIDGPSSAQILAWEHTPKLLVNLVRLVASQITDSQIKSYSSVNRGQAQVRFEFENDVAQRLRVSPIMVRFLPPDGKDALEIPLKWEDENIAVAKVNLKQKGHYLPIVDLAEDGVHKAAPVSLSYSPEFLPMHKKDGQKILQEISKITKGKRLGRVDEIFSYEDIQYAPAGYDLSRWLLIALLLLLVLEIAQKRLSIFDFINSFRKR